MDPYGIEADITGHGAAQLKRSCGTCGFRLLSLPREFSNILLFDRLGRRPRRGEARPGVGGVVEELEYV
jgi:hypothetical protein